MVQIEPQSIVYSFDAGTAYAGFAELPDGTQGAVEKHIAIVIIESFIEPADHDYLAARSLAIGGLHRSFFWSAAQAVEKYLKAFLLLNNVSVKKFSHNLVGLLTEAGKAESGFGDIDLAPHTALTLPTEVLPLTRFTRASFIAELEKYGSPNNRYNKYGSIYDTGHLFALDSLVYHLRKKMGVPSLKASFNSISKDFHRYLYDNNPYYAPNDFVHTEFSAEAFRLTHSMSVPRWEVLKNHNNLEFYIAREWLKNHMVID